MVRRANFDGIYQRPSAQRYGQQAGARRNRSSYKGKKIDETENALSHLDNSSFDVEVKEIRKAKSTMAWTKVAVPALAVLALVSLVGALTGRFDHLSLLKDLSVGVGVGALGLYSLSSWKRMGAKKKMYDFLKKTAVISSGQERELDKLTMQHVETLRSQYLEDYREDQLALSKFLCWGTNSTDAREGFYEDLAEDGTLSVIKKAILFSRNSLSEDELKVALGEVNMTDIPKLALEVSEMKDVPLHRIISGINIAIKIADNNGDQDRVAILSNLLNVVKIFKADDLTGKDVLAAYANVDRDTQKHPLLLKRLHELPARTKSAALYTPQVWSTNLSDIYKLDDVMFLLDNDHDGLKTSAAAGTRLPAMADLTLGEKNYLSEASGQYAFFRRLVNPNFMKRLLNEEPKDIAEFFSKLDENEVLIALSSTDRTTVDAEMRSAAQDFVAKNPAATRDELIEVLEGINPESQAVRYVRNSATPLALTIIAEPGFIASLRPSSSDNYIADGQKYLATLLKDKKLKPIFLALMASGNYGAIRSIMRVFGKVEARDLTNRVERENLFVKEMRNMIKPSVLWAPLTGTRDVLSNINNFSWNFPGRNTRRSQFTDEDLDKSIFEYLGLDQVAPLEQKQEYFDQY